MCNCCSKKYQDRTREELEERHPGAYGNRYARPAPAPAPWPPPRPARPPQPEPEPEQTINPLAFLDRQAALRDVFARFDVNRDEQISKFEMLQMLQYLGLKQLEDSYILG